MHIHWAGFLSAPLRVASSCIDGSSSVNGISSLAHADGRESDRGCDERIRRHILRSGSQKGANAAVPNVES